MSVYTAKQISEKLSQRADAVALYLLPNGKKEGHEWRVGSLNGEAGESLGVHLSGSKAGVWCDFNTGEAGDLLDLWRLSRSLSLANALKEAKQWLGIRDYEFTPSHKKAWAKPILPASAELKPESPIENYLRQKRKLTLLTLNTFKISATANEIIFPYYLGKELIFAKYQELERVEGKKIIRASKDCEPCLFGWQALDPHTRSVVICEGEIDAMTLHQYGYPALSVPFGGGKGKKQQWLEYEFERLSIFDEIFLCFDNDSAGEEAVNELLPRLGQHRCKVVKLPHKDANECLQAGVSVNEIKKCFDSAYSVDPQELKQANLFVNEVIEEFYPSGDKVLGVESPWERAKGKILFRPDELSVWTGTNGHGKSQFLGQVILHSMRQNTKVCIASLELKPKRLLMRLTRQAAALSNPSVEYIKAIHDWYTDKLWIFDLVGTAKHEKLLEVFIYARQRYDIDTFVIDSFMKCGIAEDDYKAQKAFIEQLCDFKNEYNCHVHLIVHPRKGIDEFRSPGKLDIKGTGAITDLADNCFTIWRNKKKENEIQKLLNTGETPDDELMTKFDCLWTCDKQRNGDWEGRIALWFDKQSYQFLNSYGQRPTPVVSYSKLNNRSDLNEN